MAKSLQILSIYLREIKLAFVKITTHKCLYFDYFTRFLVDFVGWRSDSHFTLVLIFSFFTSTDVDNLIANIFVNITFQKYYHQALSVDIGIENEKVFIHAIHDSWWIINMLKFLSPDKLPYTWMQFVYSSVRSFYTHLGIPKTSSLQRLPSRDILSPCPHMKPFYCHCQGRITRCSQLASFLQSWGFPWGIVW